LQKPQKPQKPQKLTDICQHCVGSSPNSAGGLSLHLSVSHSRYSVLLPVFSCKTVLIVFLCCAIKKARRNTPGFVVKAADF
jgi:hypothetical protein